MHSPLPSLVPEPAPSNTSLGTEASLQDDDTTLAVIAQHARLIEELSQAGFPVPGSHGQ